MDTLKLPVMASKRPPGAAGTSFSLRALGHLLGDVGTDGLAVRADRGKNRHRELRLLLGGVIRGPMHTVLLACGVMVLISAVLGWLFLPKRVAVPRTGEAGGPTLGRTSDSLA